ncbi:30S ribosomal subunit S4 [Ophiocordyceps camponoti-floridani]|uniref:30S ribosomal subunit S4 n=1 Tax=Ophiocordyceps camponoti-floridani TaxID=2030778 RepID=A0A8H4Q6H2_9HYPO|nr:30S ribosomal subunit S4 [Ophiocordyceps camponoti-floridani]
MRRPPGYYNLAKPKLRPSWNKHVLYYLTHNVGSEPKIDLARTFFQQKWAAKSKTRGYHGDHISERKWVRLFSRRLLSVVDMPPQYLATHDGSEQAAGRGSGLTTSTVTAESYSSAPQYSSTVNMSARKGSVNKLLGLQHEKMTPYMQMTFAPLERRLETVIFRSLFASSIREARQFCIHGAVKVNGIKTVYPGYQLNPGDMFQVDVDKVLYATGEQRNPGLPPPLRWRKLDRMWLRKTSADLKAKATGSQDEQPAEGTPKTVLKGKKSVSPWRLKQMMVEYTLERTLKGIEIKDGKEWMLDMRLRHFRLAARRWLSLPGDFEMSPARLMHALWQLFARPEMAPKLSELWLQKSAEAGDEKKPMTNELRAIDTLLRGDILEQIKRQYQELAMGSVTIGPNEMMQITQLLENLEGKLVDGKEPYAMPWRPRPFMSAFAFIPRYLEVNPYICAGVYVRHPVARKGLAEVPTPFSYLTNQLVHHWYMGRG